MCHCQNTVVRGRKFFQRQINVYYCSSSGKKNWKEFCFFSRWNVSNSHWQPAADCVKVWGNRHRKEKGNSKQQTDKECWSGTIRLVCLWMTVACEVAKIFAVHKTKFGDQVAKGPEYIQSFCGLLHVCGCLLRSTHRGLHRFEVFRKSICNHVWGWQGAVTVAGWCGQYSGEKYYEIL